jgi:hypothetical protein
MITARITALALTMVLAASCGTKRPATSVDITIQNDSTNNLDWVELVWGEGNLSVGVMSAGNGKTILDAGIPKSATDTATLEFVENNDPKLRAGPTDRAALEARKKHSIQVDVSRLRRLAPGRYDVTFSILSLSEAKLRIEKMDE